MINLQFCLYNKFEDSIQISCRSSFIVIIIIIDVVFDFSYSMRIFTLRQWKLTYLVVSCFCFNDKGHILDNDG
jgi:hypothetical protein